MALLSTLDKITKEASYSRITPEDLIQTFSFLLSPKFEGLLHQSLDLIENSGTEQFQLISTLPVGDDLPNKFFWRLPHENNRNHYHRIAIENPKPSNLIVLQHYCPCKSFLDQARTTSDDLICKHIVATRVIFVLKRYKNVVVKDNEFLVQICADCHLVS